MKTRERDIVKLSVDNDDEDYYYGVVGKASVSDIEGANMRYSWGA